VARAPISGLEVGFAAADGHDDLVLLEQPTSLALAVALLERRCPGLDAAALPVGDVDVLVAELRRGSIGDALVAEASCAECGARVDVHFSLADLIAHERPRRSRLAEREPDGWWTLDGVRFRAPTAADVLACADTADLVRRCVEGTSEPRALRRIERALELVAPTLHSVGAGICPECGCEVAVDVDARSLCLDELRLLAGSVLEDVHLLAGAYGWDEATVLALPSSRRQAYAQLIQADAGQPLELVDA
jgi:hypothetical protein